MEHLSTSDNTCVRCFSKIGISKLTTLLQAGIHFVVSSHRNIYWTGQRYVIDISKIMKHSYLHGKNGISTSSKVCCILSAKYSRNLNVYHTVSHVRITMPQHELSYNPNRFAIRDPRGGNWGEWGQNTEKVKIMLKI